jgi:hypothetical protein
MTHKSPAGFPKQNAHVVFLPVGTWWYHVKKQFKVKLADFTAGEALSNGLYWNEVSTWLSLARTLISVKPADEGFALHFNVKELIGLADFAGNRYYAMLLLRVETPPITKRPFSSANGPVIKEKSAPSSIHRQPNHHGG